MRTEIEQAHPQLDGTMYFFVNSALIGQPEDDLDSRSIYEYIVPYLISRKKERQILMVSHNANLVVGADSEQIIVANRHGADRKNRGDKTFDYLSGAIEDSRRAVQQCIYSRNLWH